jgi:hypothetical protein
MKRSVVIALILVAQACFAGPIEEQQLIGHWKTRENIDLLFTKEHTFTMKSPDLPPGVAANGFYSPR